MTPTRIAISGAAGRMGRRLIALAGEDETLLIVAALERAGHPELGKDAGLIAGIGDIGIPFRASLDAEVDAIIDFSTPEAADAITAACVERGISLVAATTGLSQQQQQRLQDAADIIAIVSAPNMSLAVNLTMKLAEIAAKALTDQPGTVDVEIVERHHRFKEDAPSGTALKFGEIISQVMGQTQHQHGREGRPGKRPPHEIGYHALRIGDNPGEHAIVFGMLGETIELSVRATNRDCYALGALAAAKFAAKQNPGRYTMFDVLGI